MERNMYCSVVCFIALVMREKGQEIVSNNNHKTKNVLLLTVPVVSIATSTVLDFLNYIGLLDAILISSTTVLVLLISTSLYLNSDHDNRIKNTNDRLDKINVRIGIMEDFIDILISAGQKAAEYYFVEGAKKDFEEVQSHLMGILLKEVQSTSLTMISEYRHNMSPPEMHKLLGKYENNEITDDEATTLKSLLEKEKKVKEKQGDKTGAIVLGTIIMALLNRLSNNEKTNFSKPIKSIYVPPFGLQGQTFSCHITWDKEYVLDCLQISVQDGMELQNIYNSEADYVEYIGAQSVKVLQTTENGYLGFVLKSSRVESSSQTTQVKIDLSFKNGENRVTNSYSFPLQTFRPELSIAEQPTVVSISYKKDEVAPKVEGKILLINKGSGTAFAVMVPKKGSEIKLTTLFLDETKEFLAKLNERFEDLRSEYPQEEDILKSLLEVFNLVYEIGVGNEIEPEVIEDKIDHIQPLLEREEKSNQDFTIDLGDTISDVYHSVISSAKSFQSMLRALESMKGEKVTLLNPMSAIEISGETEVEFEIHYFDAIWNHFPELTTNAIKFVSNSNDSVRVPIYDLIGLQGGENEPK